MINAAVFGKSRKTAAMALAFNNCPLATGINSQNVIYIPAIPGRAYNMLAAIWAIITPTGGMGVLFITAAYLKSDLSSGCTENGRINDI